ncbi:hypothetical protein [Cellvibrio fontiphilus]|jgi:hypothetical protein|uniref:Lipoprotein n=1 Tax=Cellvibrio fontiphilus TaxID=1815559 RepID=A0ABV7FF48_9GAMM
MKSLVIVLGSVVFSLASSVALACSKPANKPEIPDAATVVTAQMVKANNDVKAYVQGMQDYLGCAGLARNEEKKELDDLKKFADDFNKVIREFKAKSAG